MANTKQNQSLLPWSNSQLETLLLGHISHGTETAKVDLKAEIELATPEQKSELLKDVNAIANTYDENYDDFGFLLYGVKGKAVVGITKTESDTDKFQNTIEQLLKNYISPMPQVYVVGFETTAGLRWGAIVIPPRNNKPYMFCKEFSCQNPKYSRKKGEWFVRNGATTDPGMPEDLARINQKQTDLLLEPLRESVRQLSSRVAKTERQYSSALFKLVKQAVSATSFGSKATPEADQGVSDDISESLGIELPARLSQRLKTPKDGLAEDLVTEAKKIRDYLEGAEPGLSWAPQPGNAAANKIIIEGLEEKTKLLLRSVATIVLNDNKGEYTEALLRAIKVLAKLTEVPSGTPFNDIGKAIRLYPLGLVLTTLFVCGVAANRGDLLKKILAIPLRHQRKSDTSHLLNVFFFWNSTGLLINDAFGQRWCEPMMQRARQVIRDSISDMVTDLTEPEFYFPGEFVLAISNIDRSMSEGDAVDHRVPLSGLYLYMHEGRDPIEALLLEQFDWLGKIFGHPLSEILDMFDRNAGRMSSPGCLALGMHGLKTREILDKAIQLKAQKQ